MTRTVLMEGYYGRGNFGDDVLMAVTYGVLRNHMPDAKIALVIGDYQRDYASTMLQGVEVQRPDRHAHYDMIVHGGGGVFFDFKTYHAGFKALEALVRIIGFKAFLVLEKLSRSISGRHRFTTDKRIGLGIGVGGFSAGSPRMLRALPVLADFKALWVRDAQSIAQLKQYKAITSAEIVQGSDLAFLTDYWKPAVTKSAGDRPRLGIVLRDWPDMDFATIQAMLQQLSTEYTISGFIFDDASDSEMKKLLAPYTTHIWNPQQMSIADFAAPLAAQDVLLTSRAHGAICGACLGVPSVIVNIEPKMEQVHGMLPDASMLVSPRDTAHWPDAIKKAHSIAAETIATDVTRNRTASENALQQMKRWFA